jgi:hypothetical protein
VGSNPYFEQMWRNRVSNFLNNHNFAEDDDWQKTEELLDAVSTYRHDHPGEGLQPQLFGKIVEWKLRDQIQRTVDHLSDINDSMIYEVTRAAFRLDHHDPAVSSRARTEVLRALPGVGLGVASGILTMYFPESFGVIDFRVWDEVHELDPSLPPLKHNFTIGDYAKYLAMIRSFAEEIEEPPQLVDFALWSIWKLRRPD